MTAEEATEEIYLAARIASHDNSEEGRAARDRKRAWHRKDALGLKDQTVDGRPAAAAEIFKGDYEPLDYGPDGQVEPVYDHPLLHYVAEQKAKKLREEEARRQLGNGST